MAIDQKTRDIDGVKYTVTQFTATKSIRLMKRIVSLVGEPLFLFASGGSEEVEAEGVRSAVATLVQRLDEEDIVELILDMLEGVIAADGAEVAKDFDLRFAGKLGHMVNLLAFALEVQYRDFFDVARSAAKARTSSESGPSSSESGPDD